ncbi:hypothetical protein [Plebeiibacterium sediminum]|uniref:DUF4412 domain-containing protein n=1 Tax=Plebeiibacterium sediminum TaxID=2992112 RepID=A0AAE3SGJ0_9BACT|nr:hypothetical protein [Plebeiobacterium sediminum]MCW3788147.1 hypothetical protein [Plebeiobacterium sediminum]
MRRLLFSMLMITIISVSINAQNTQEVNRYALKSGYLKLELSGSTTGTRELWWDDYGEKTCEIEKSETTINMFGMKHIDKTHMLTINVGDTYWTVDYINNTAFKGEIEIYDAAQQFAESMTEEEREDFTNNVLESLGGQKQGTETINGFKCDVFSVMGAKSWLYKGIAIKTTAKIMGIENNEIFVDFKPGSAIPSSRFTPPSEYKYLSGAL